MKRDYRAKQRTKIAREAAQLLYTGQEKEFKQAKFQAAKALGLNTLPSNMEIAVELDRIAELQEGRDRLRRLVEMRRKALQIMQDLIDFNPILVGSVWRGTANRHSDVDVVTFAQDPEEVVRQLREGKQSISDISVRAVTKSGEKKGSVHIQLNLKPGKAEIIVRCLSDLNRVNKCEIYGDTVTGLTIQQLEKILRENPTRRFLPF
ncbi:MAG: nucleotidyltransferase domain-containing protein [Candidatus Bathyarchaeota archaeon]|nr:nucleotidyltransferase domain-containing protein [Candidatus Bathyarchaeota archaeon]